MKKIFITFLLFLMFIPACFAEDYPAKGGREEYPIYWYLMRHGEKLKKVLDHKKFFRLRGWGCSYLVNIAKDGTILPLKVTFSQNKYFDKQIKKIIETTKAEPFGDEIDLDEIIIEIDISYNYFSDLVKIGRTSNKTLNDEIYLILIITTN